MNVDLTFHLTQAKYFFKSRNYYPALRIKSRERARYNIEQVRKLRMLSAGKNNQGVIKCK